MFKYLIKKKIYKYKKTNISIVELTACSLMNYRYGVYSVL